MKASEHSLFSSYPEMLLEHLFVGEIMRHVWMTPRKRLEILKPQVDDGGYDLVLEINTVVRHIQLKATFRDAKVRNLKINMGLASKPSGCVVIVIFDETSLNLGPFLWFSSAPGKPLPDLSPYRIAKHTKGNAQGKKLERPRIRVVPRSAFETVGSISELEVKLFGAEAS